MTVSVHDVWFQKSSKEVTKNTFNILATGFDFLIDDTFHVWLIEINVNPALACNCEGLKEVIPGIVEESINISLECFEKSRRNRLPLCPLQTRKDMVVLYSEDTGTR